MSDEIVVKKKQRKKGDTDIGKTEIRRKRETEIWRKGTKRYGGEKRWGDEARQTSGFRGPEVRQSSCGFSRIALPPSTNKSYWIISRRTRKNLTMLLGGNCISPWTRVPASSKMLKKSPKFLGYVHVMTITFFRHHSFIRTEPTTWNCWKTLLLAHIQTSWSFHCRPPCVQSSSHSNLARRWFAAVESWDPDGDRWFF